jgi:hypothetical protein
MVRRLTVETVCFEVMLASMATGLSVWLFGMMRKSFGAIPALLWIVLTCLSLACAAIVGVLEFTR